MDHKKLETVREIRLWITQILAPGILIAGTVLSIPEVNDAVKVSCVKVKKKFKKIFKKEKPQ